jgi:hypothetical protein
MNKLILSAAALTLTAVASAATVTQTCSATIQSVGACASADNAKSGILIAYWASSIDEAPADADIASNAADLRDAICLNFGIAPVSCTKEAADGALRRFLEGMVRSYRAAKKVSALPAQAAPVLDSQGNQ